MTLTWRQVKQIIEDQGVRDNDEIAWIDLDVDTMPVVERFPKDNSVMIKGRYPTKEEAAHFKD